METEQRLRIISEKLDAAGLTVNGWAKRHELDHRVVDGLIRGDLQGTRGITRQARKVMESFFGPIFDN